MYSFNDTIPNDQATKILPAEAVSIDGQFIEDAIDGYRTLYAGGRESLALVVDSFDVGSADGETVKGTRYPSRTLTVGFQLVADTAQEFRQKFNHLNNLLSMEEADFVFNDEPDKYFTGVPILDMEIEPGKKAVTGEYHIYCAFPFKRSVEVYEASPTTIEDTGAEFRILYNGNYPAKPILRAEFAGALEGGDYSDDGDCGFVAFVDDDENIIQLGNPDAIDIDPAKTATQLINREFTTTEEWATSGGATWGNKSIAGSVSANQTINDANWNKGKGHSLKVAKPSYGSGSSWHGPMLRYPVTDGMINFDIAIVQMLAISANAQCGSFEVGAYKVDSGSRTMICGIVIDKTANGTKGTVRYIVNGQQVGSASIDLAFNNTHFGYCKKTAIYTTQYYNKKKKKWQNKKIKKAKTRKVTKGYNYTQSNLNTSIKKAGAVVTFKVGNLKAASYTNADIEEVAAHEISLHFGQYGSKATLHTNAVSSIKLTRQGGPNFDDYQNVFTAGDIVEADCNDANVYLYRTGTEEGHLAARYGALGNDWEDFALRRGVNSIAVTWSPWVKPAYKPTITILYNEVYI